MNVFLNEVELCDLTGRKGVEEGLRYLGNLMPTSSLVVTLGEKGALYLGDGELLSQQAYSAQVVDTTAAGDTFLGFFMAAVVSKSDISTCLRRASKAASLCVARAGASDSIPLERELVSS